MKMYYVPMNWRFFSSLFRIRMAILCALTLAGTFTRTARADCVPARRVSVPKNVTSNDKALALGRYKTGNELLKKSDYEGALALFLQSRDLWPNRSNTKNAAICLFELGRYPEALALYEDLAERFGADLDDEERALVATTVVELKKKVLFAKVLESKGTFSIDDDACGALPRRGPMYLMPGTHILRVLRPGEPESLTAFSGNGGERVFVEIPKAAQLPPVPPPPGQWFVQASIGPAIGWSGVGTLPIGQLEQSTGLITQAHGGYWLSNGTMVALTTGILYFDSFNAPFTVEKGFSPAVDFKYNGSAQNPLFAPFVGVVAGWGTHLRDRLDIWFRGGLGLMSTQSKNGVQVNLIPLLEDGSPQDVRIPVDVAGRQIIRSVPGYASLEIGGAWHVWNLHVGMTIGALFLFDNGPLLPDVYLMPRGRDSEFYNGSCSPNGMMTGADHNDADCVPALRLRGQLAYRPTFILLPQIVIGF